MGRYEEAQRLASETCGIQWPSGEAISAARPSVAMQ